MRDYFVGLNSPFVQGADLADEVKRISNVTDTGLVDEVNQINNVVEANLIPPTVPVDTELTPQTPTAPPPVKGQSGKYLQYNIPGAKHGTRKYTDLLVTHRTAGHGFHPNDTRLTKDGLGAHYTITQDGKIHQVGKDSDKMWHAGKVNPHSIGIEVTGNYSNGKWEEMTDAQKASLIILYKDLSSRYTFKDIKGHYQVAAKTGTEGAQPRDYLKGLR